MAGHSLLTRIRRPELAQARRQVSDEEIRTSILQNLRQMCATRMGSSLTCADYGIVSVSDIVHSCPDALGLVSKTIRHTIATYEPRLSSVTVRAVPIDENSPLTLRFDISATMMNGTRKLAVKFQTVVDAARKVDVV